MYDRGMIRQYNADIFISVASPIIRACLLKQFWKKIMLATFE
jgi:hypothetical protein